MPASALFWPPIQHAGSRLPPAEREAVSNAPWRRGVRALSRRCLGRGRAALRGKLPIEVLEEVGSGANDSSRLAHRSCDSVSPIRCRARCRTRSRKSGGILAGSRIRLAEKSSSCSAGVRPSSSAAVQTLSAMTGIVPAWAPSGAIPAVRCACVLAVSSDQPEGHKSAGQRGCRSSSGFSCKALYGVRFSSPPQWDGVARLRGSFKRAEPFPSACPWPVRRPACRESGSSASADLRCSPLGRRTRPR